METIGDLESKISEVSGINCNHLVMLLKHEVFSRTYGSQYRTEVYNPLFRKPKIIEDGPKLDETTIIYIEQGDIKQKSELCKWHQEFNKEFDKMYLNVVFEETKKQIEVKKSYTFLELKQLIS